MTRGIKVVKHDSGEPSADRLCRHRSTAVFRGRRRTVTDDSGLLAITAWTCADCGELIEEVRMLSRNGVPERRPVRYAVSQRQPMDHHPTVSARH
jgi:hypothetical protein